MSHPWHHWRRRLRHSSQNRASGADPMARFASLIDEYKQKVRAMGGNDAQLLERLLVLQAPRAAHAQAQMDTHPHGYHNREKRLFELIDFNDTFVAAVLAEPESSLPGFAERMKRIMTAFCKKEKLPMFTDEQYDAIVRGLAREVAVYRGAIKLGFEATMTSRVDDAFGIDMVIRDPKSGRSANIDVKTPSAFRYRLEELVKEKRISDNELLVADRDDFVTVINYRDGESIPVTIMCVRPEDLGEVVAFSFERTDKLKQLLHFILETDGHLTQRQVLTKIEK